MILNSRLLLFFLAFLLVGTTANSQGVNWASSVYPDSITGMGSVARANSTAIDGDGNVYVAGWTGGNSRIGTQIYPSTHYNSNVIKYDAAGNVLWVKRFGAPSSSIQLTDMKVDRFGNLFVLGSISASIGSSASITIDGTTINAATNARDYVLIKWNSAGTLQWISTGGGAGKRYPFALAVDQASNVYMAGTYSGTSEFDGITLTPAFPASQSGTGFVAKFSATGTVQWAMSATTSTSGTSISVRNVGVDAAGNIFLEGITSHSFNWGTHTVTATQSGTAFWLKLNSTGQAQNSFTLPVPVLGWTNTMVVDAIGNTYLGNAFSGTLDLGGITLTSGQGSSSYLAKYDPSGVLQWVTQLQQVPGSQNYVRTHDLAIDSQGKLYLSGYFKGNIMVGSIPLTAAVPPGTNSEESFAAAFDALTGNALWAVKGTGVAVEGVSIDANDAGQVAWVGDFQDGSVSVGSLVTGTQVQPFTSAFYVSRILQDYNTVTGTVFVDANNNGVQDANETGLPSGSLVGVTPGNMAFVTQSNGGYSATTQLGNYTVGVTNPPLYYNTIATGPTTASFATFGNVAPGRDFALQPIANQQDLKVSVTALQPPRPGFTTPYRVTYKNVGTVAISSGTVSLTADPLFTYLSSSQTATQTGNTLTWSFSNLEPNQTVNINVLFSLTAVAPLGDSVTCVVSIEPLAGDLTPANNTETSVKTIVGSYDPNSIEVNYNQLTVQQLQSGQKLDYTIRFQNMGTDTAFTVMLRDSLPASLLNLGTIELVASSHNCSYTLNADGILTVLFTSIKLPHQSINSIGSNGFVRFQIQPFTTLAVGNIIPNEADIYFDYNAPITTNTAQTEVVFISGVSADNLNMNWSVYPNPAVNAVTVNAHLEQFGEVTLRLVNVLGQVVHSRTAWITAGNFQQELLLGELPTGVYSLQLHTDAGTAVKQIVKQ